MASSELNLRKRSSSEAADQEIEHADFNNATSQFENQYQFERIAKCFGDCDTSDDCQEGLVCYHRDIVDDEEEDIIPGCSLDDNEELHTTNSVCVTPEDMPTNAIARTAPIRRKLQLGECQGDCDSNSDCRGGLVCYQRGRGDRVPGCSGKNLGTTRDYCVQSNSNQRNTDSEPAGFSAPAPAPATSTSSAFQLKIYWQRGYDWQGEYFERECTY